MSLLDNIKKVTENEDIVKAVKDKTGLDVKNLDLKDLDTSKLDEIKALVKKAAGKVDVTGIAKKVGVSEDIVKKVMDKLD